MSDKNYKSLQFYAKVQGSVSQFYSKSQPININKVGQTREITMDHPETLSQLQFGISIHHSSYPFNKTIIITIVPKYLLVNKLQKPILIRQKMDCDDQNYNNLPPNNNISFNTSREGLKKSKKQHGCHVTLLSDLLDNQRELHLERLDLNKPRKCTQIQFKLLEQQED